MTTTPTIGRAATLAVAIGAWVVLTAPLAAASDAPLVPRPVFAQREAVDPLVTAAAVDDFAGFDGTNLHGWVETTGLTWTVHTGAMRLQTGAVELDLTPFGVATLPTAFSNVLLKAQLEFPGPDRSTGVVLNRGFGGDLLVRVENAGADQRVTLYFDDGVTQTLLDASTPAGGLPSSVRLVVESSDGVVRAWIDGALAFEHVLTGPAAGVALHQEHGIVVGHSGDRVTSLLVLAPT